MIQQSQIENTINQIVKGYKPQKIIMYGSCAKGDKAINIGSDLDLIMIKNTDEEFLERIDKVLDCCQEPIGVEPLVYTEEEIKKMLDEGNDFLETALSEGVVMYGE